MNSCNFIGRPTSDIELKHTPGGKYVCNFDLAVKRPFTNDTTDFFTCVAWDKKAETIAKYVSKGQLIGISGYLYSRKFQDKNGNNRTTFEINISDFDFCEKKSANVDVQVDPLQEIAKKCEEKGVPKSADDGFTEIIDDDLPF